MGKELLVLGPFELRLYIENLREELIDIGKKNGLSHQLTIQASEQLDFFLNEYKRVKEKSTNYSEQHQTLFTKGLVERNDALFSNVIHQNIE